MAEGRKAGFEAVVGTAVPAGDKRSLVAFAEDIEQSLLRAGCPGDEAQRLATMRLVANLVVGRAMAGRPLSSAEGPLARAARLTGLPAPAVQGMVGHIALRDPRTVAEPSPRALEMQLDIAASLASLREVSFWLSHQANEQLECVAHTRGSPSSSVARVARRAFHRAAQTPIDGRRELVAVPVEPGAMQGGALAARASRGGAGVATMTLRGAVPLVRLILERDALLNAAEARGADAVERALVRFGFDVHDGPAQGIAALQAEIRTLEGQVAGAFSADPRAELLLGRLHDLEARSNAVAEQIRALASSARSPSGDLDPVKDVLDMELRELREHTGIVAELELSGPVDAATPSQRIALLRGIQEALRNVREHSGARSVRLRVEAGKDRIEAEVRDDGCGFDPEQVHSRAPIKGHMGLAGIVERAQLIGGDCEISSADGGPTSIKLLLPRWDPAER